VHLLLLGAAAGAAPSPSLPAWCGVTSCRAARQQLLLCAVLDRRAARVLAARVLAAAAGMRAATGNGAGAQAVHG
jgi:hypothetical protein